MTIKIMAGLVATLSLVTSIANANWVCNIANKRGEHWTFTAPTQAAAQTSAQSICNAFSFDAAHCVPDCYDNGVAGGRWHCVFSNRKGEHWSYIAPTHAQAFSLAKNACDANTTNPANCTPACIPE